MSSIQHHPGDETLMSYAAGSLPAALALVTGCHLQFCSECRQRVAEAEALGGAMVDDLAPRAMSTGRREAILEQLDMPSVEARKPARTTAWTSPPPSTGVPRLLHRFLGGSDLESLEWKTVVPGLQRVSLPCDEGNAFMLRIAAGKKMPVHSHQGNEMTLILQGGYSDALGKFNAGDVADLDGSTEHQPIADADQDCICLAALDEPLRFKGWIARAMQPFVRF